MAQNEMQWSSATPGLLIIMVDQSGSMMNKYDGNDSRSEFAAKAVNRVINTLIQVNSDGKKIKNRCFIVVIGYDYEAKILTSGYLSELDTSFKRIDNIKKLIPDGNGGVVETDSKLPIWIEPIYEDHVTNMMEAFVKADAIISNWIQDKPNNPAPVIINISDGLPWDGREFNDGEGIVECMKETIQIVNHTKSLSTSDGNVQIFNAMIGDEGEKVIFPKNPESLDQIEAQFLYEISTEIPQSYQGAAAKNGLHYESGARGAIYNADAEYLIKLISFGSSKGNNYKDK